MLESNSMLFVTQQMEKLKSTLSAQSRTAELWISYMPPSEGAAKMHALRVHYQSVFWRTLGQTDLKPTDWGWKEINGKLVPVHLQGDVAPDNMLNVVRCSCLTKCTSSLCSCKRHGLECVSACKNCRGFECCNSSVDFTDRDNPVGDEPVCLTELPDYVSDEDLYLYFEYEEDV